MACDLIEHPGGPLTPFLAICGHKQQMMPISDKLRHEIRYVHLFDLLVCVATQAVSEELIGHPDLAEFTYLGQVSLIDVR